VRRLLLAASEFAVGLKTLSRRCSESLCWQAAGKKTARSPAPSHSLMMKRHLRHERLAPPLTGRPSLDTPILRALPWAGFIQPLARKTSAAVATPISH
jgi:hypothetical protein